MRKHIESQTSVALFANQVKPTPGELERFLSRVSKTGNGGCWIWTASKARFGYGCFYFQGRLRVAHRLAWVFFRGVIPQGILVLHNCPDGDNPACVNPDHLWLGTHADNIADCIAKKRNNRGERNGGNKLTEAQMRDIRFRRRNGEILTSIAKDFGISFGHVSAIALGVKWKDFE